jgi:hypothetical protein
MIIGTDVEFGVQDGGETRENSSQRIKREFDSRVSPKCNG